MIFRIKELLQEKRLKAQDVAPMVGVTAQHMSALVAERYMPSMELLLKLADVFGVHVSEMFVPPSTGCQMEGEIICPNCGKPIELHSIVYAAVPREKPKYRRNPSPPKDAPESPDQN